MPEMASNHKPIRSRFSSPLHSTSPSGYNGQRSFMQKWLEPPVQNKASFQEAGLIRGGVVENMAPLGTLPKAAMHKKSPVNGDALPTPPVKTRIVLKKPYVAPTVAERTPSRRERSAEEAGGEVEMVDAMDSMDAVDVVDAAPLSPLSQPLLPISIMDDGEDEEYVPKKSKVRPTTNQGNQGNQGGSVNQVTPNNARRHSARRRSARTSPAPAAPAAPVDSSPIHLATTHANANATSTATATKPTSISSSISTKTTTTPMTAKVATTAATTTKIANTPTISSPRFHPPSSILNHREPDKEFADKVVEAAVDEALRHYRYPTAWALRLLYDENSSDPHFVSMIEDIFHQRADIDTIKEFNRLVSDKKRDGKKDNKGCYYFVPPSTGSRFTPHKPKPAPYADLVKMDLSILPEDTPDEHVNKKVKLDHRDVDDLGANEDDDNNTVMDLDEGSNHDSNQANLVNLVDHVDHVNHANHIKANGVSHPKSLTGSKSPQKIQQQQKSPAKSPQKSPKSRKTRSGSVSSSSSLSSVPDDVPDDYEEYMDQVDDNLGVARPIAAEPNNAQIPAGSSQPISGHQKKPAAKKKNGASPKYPPSQKDSRSYPPSRDSSMPAVVTANGSPHPPHHHHNHQNKQQASSITSFKFASRFGDLDDSDLLVRKKLSKKLENTSTTKDISEDSFIRRPLDLDNLSFDLAVPPPPPPHAAEQSRSSRTPALSSRATRAAKRHHDELDASISPTAQSFRAADLDPPSPARGSRAATPSNPRSNKKPRAGLRVKNSPMKKKGTSAGIPRSNGDRPSPVGNGPPNNQDENDDSCYTCGGNGELVCCDGCNYSFHFLCIDPPMDQGHMPDEWYCNECKNRQCPPFGEHIGPLRSLFTALDRKNPRAFRLPEDVRDLFEGVRTGPEGEYEEIVPPKPKTSKKGVEEPFDFFKVRNADGAVLCHHCQKAVSDNRPIIPCSVCGLHWHLECLDPPLAVPPVPRTWRCPCHVDDILSELPERLAPAHRHRKIKNAPVIELAYSRGMANDGWIEVDNDDSEDEASAWRRYKGFGQTHRLSAKGIKMDFISRVRQNRQQNSALVGSSSPAPTVQPSVRSIEEQQAALNLAQLASSSNDGLGIIRQAMISQASPSMLSLMAAGDAARIAAGDLSSVDTVSLEAMLLQADSMKEAIRQALQSRNYHDPGNIAAETVLEGTTPEAHLSNESPEDDKTVVADDKNYAPSKDATEDSNADDRKSTTDDYTMQID
ncbi:uncharacterized protein F4812DRAFT_45615 [Daldinia caldariorum]|uniref:uncharacterized protein n=1 Tax=Daldinia caldariorum TaxID=326644 RepID=UPI002007C8F8|nr:uncharacterized protein F4812DRAFT_45615 [Daldinia caldariorum]KAI1467011.1 hypothetical protein F4812DRAFT_45615 [Daldinia caldariorum]